jgi:hypothetical protein
MNQELGDAKLNKRVQARAQMDLSYPQCFPLTVA